MSENTKALVSLGITLGIVVAIIGVGWLLLRFPWQTAAAVVFLWVFLALWGTIWEKM